MSSDDKTSRKTSSCTTDVEIVQTSYTWTLKNYSFLSGQDERVINSAIFAMGKHNEYEWRLRLYPNGLEESSTSHVALFLQLTSPNTPEVLAKFKISIIKASGEDYVLDSPKVRRYTQGKSFGYNEFINKKRLFDERKGFLQNDVLRISCEVVIGTGTVTNLITSSDENSVKPEKHLVEDMENLLTTRIFTDVTLIAGARRFELHRSILAARSPVFAAMFEHNMKERKENEAEITDIDEDVLEQLIKFIYTSKVDRLDDFATKLVAAADKYALDDLKQICERSILKGLTTSNAVSVLVLADTHNLHFLKKQTKIFMKQNAEILVDNFTDMLFNSP